MELLPLQRPVKASDLPLERVATNAQLSDSAKVAEVSRQFEAVLLRQIISESQKPVFGASALTSSVSNDIYRDMVTTQLADSISKSGTFGLARSIQPQLTHQLMRAPASGETDPTQLKPNDPSQAAGALPAMRLRPTARRAPAASGSQPGLHHR